MTDSMTAFARVEISLDGSQLIWEIRSVNHRYLDINLRLPDELRYLDTSVRQRINEKLNRGRIDAQLRLEKSGVVADAESIDAGVLDNLISTLKQIEDTYPEVRPARSTDILGWPGVMKVDPIDTDALQQHSLELLDNALCGVSQNRRREGQRMAQIIADKANQCRSIVSTLNDSITGIQMKTRQKWCKRIEEFAASLDPERMAQETALLLTRSDVSEELDRIQTHLDEVSVLLEAKKPVGRSLDFLMQELNREANTLGSKSIDEKMTTASIELKVLIDQMREQVQNIE